MQSNAQRGTAKPYIKSIATQDEADEFIGSPKI